LLGLEKPEKFFGSSSSYLGMKNTEFFGFHYQLPKETALSAVCFGNACCF